MEQIASRDGQAFAKSYGDRVIPGTADAVFAERQSYSAFSNAGVAAFQAETENLRAKGRSEAFIEAWLNAANGAWAQRTKQLHILSRAPV